MYFGFGTLTFVSSYLGSIEYCILNLVMSKNVIVV